MLNKLKITSTFFILLMIIGCADSASSENTTTQEKIPPTKSCMEKVLSIDQELIKIRNQNSKEITLSKTIFNYVHRLTKIDFDDCPIDLVKAFKKHQNAWLEIISVTDNYPDLRGEFNEIFNMLKNEKDKDLFNKKLEVITKTRAEIERVMNEK